MKYASVNNGDWYLEYFHHGIMSFEYYQGGISKWKKTKKENPETQLNSGV